MCNVCVYIYSRSFRPLPYHQIPLPDYSFDAKASSSSWWEGGEKLLGRTRSNPAHISPKTLANLYKPPPPRRRCRRRYTLGKMRASERLQRVIRIYTYCTIRTYRVVILAGDALFVVVTADGFRVFPYCWTFSPTRQRFSFRRFSKILPPLVPLVFYNAVSLFSYTTIKIKSSKLQRSVHHTYSVQV